ncbi:hypothetical protein M501DRAFT_1003030 [Patellaria atrata CBS 101060]|uniref:Uncharacterized protein n=1 Tax=Patellaria atrata CBS 101060 TaxID=1346257 RepID=A0A9P4VRP0_9PEZI|nr:hypothetical protein M501DRAFT_1003030 [Patellaria atrata CBS 101060]
MPGNSSTTPITIADRIAYIKETETTSFRASTTQSLTALATNTQAVLESLEDVPTINSLLDALAPLTQRITSLETPSSYVTSQAVQTLTTISSGVNALLEREDERKGKQERNEQEALRKRIQVLEKENRHLARESKDLRSDLTGLRSDSQSLRGDKAELKRMVASLQVRLINMTSASLSFSPSASRAQQSPSPLSPASPPLPLSSSPVQQTKDLQDRLKLHEFKTRELHSELKAEREHSAALKKEVVFLRKQRDEAQAGFWELRRRTGSIPRRKVDTAQLMKRAVIMRSYHAAESASEEQKDKVEEFDADEWEREDGEQDKKVMKVSVVLPSIPFDDGLLEYDEPPADNPTNNRALLEVQQAFAASAPLSEELSITENDSSYERDTESDERHNDDKEESTDNENESASDKNDTTDAKSERTYNEEEGTGTPNSSDSTHEASTEDEKVSRNGILGVPLVHPQIRSAKESEQETLQTVAEEPTNVSAVKPTGEKVRWIEMPDLEEYAKSLEEQASEEAEKEDAEDDSD